MVKKDCYVVKLIPKYKGSGYPHQIMQPYLHEVKWNRKRAIKEAKFALAGRMWTGASVKDAYVYKLKKVSCSLRRKR